MPRSTTLGSSQQSPTVDALQASDGDMPDLGHEQARAYSREASRGTPNFKHLLTVTFGHVSPTAAQRVAKRRGPREPDFGHASILGSGRGAVSHRAAKADMKKRAVRYKQRLSKPALQNEGNENANR